MGYIRDTDFLAIDNRTESVAPGQVNSQPNAINHYIVECLWQEDGKELAGTSNDILSDHLMVRWDEINQLIKGY